MSQPENPYQAPTSTIAVDRPAPVPRTGPRPRALWVLLGCYAITYVLEVVALTSMGPDGGQQITGPLGMGAYSLMIGICLWRGVNWVRMWVVLSTVLTLLVLWMLANRGMVGEQPVLVMACLLRISVAVMLFLPSVHRWFSPRGT
ncbi:hypothetical protein [Pseudoxanthomonas sp. PXM02]|uniref:hypothetical protein n=1 Tax=Pseudoxanthomonas sp. PXM02 TaxID=2769294 RepID=UPI00177BF7A7|nr:hypothetical protein [Pseudoxanthomonas sp. PXM02]MBD9478844.1 hypothetical protein [Pseudoxanthomonas sp. PXM02]